jgi:hypothetical protein
LAAITLSFWRLVFNISREGAKGKKNMEEINWNRSICQSIKLKASICLQQQQQVSFAEPLLFGPSSSMRPYTL